MSTFPSSVSTFNNYLVNTREARVTGPREILNDLAKNTYMFAEMARTSEAGLAIQSGREISDTIKLTPFSNSRTYTPGDNRTATRGPTDRRIFMPWRFHETNRPYTEAEIDTNEGDEYTQFKNLEFSITQDLKTDHLNFLETSLWRVPDFAQMESRTIQPGLMASIPMFITDSGLQFSTTYGTNTIAGLSPQTETNWRNQVGTYDSANPDDAINGLFSAFDEMMIRLRFKRPPNMEKYMEDDELRALKICTNLDGLNMFQGLLRSANDQTRAGPQDPAYAMPQFKGIPIEYVSELDTALLETTGAVTGTTNGVEAGTAFPAGRARFYFINCKFLKVFFHRKHMMRETDPILGGVQQRDTSTLFMESWCNTFPRSRKRQGIVRPA